MGTGNPNPRLIEREQRSLDRNMDEFRMALLKMQKPNENFYPDSAVTKAIVAIDEANKETRRIYRMNRLRDLRRLPVGHPDRAYWYKTGDGRINANDKDKPKRLSLAGSGEVTVKSPAKLRLSVTSELKLGAYRRKKYTYV